MSKKFLLSSLIIAFIYLVLFIYLINHNLVGETLRGDYSLSYKISILWSLLWGLGATLSLMGQVLVILIAIFTGMNLSLGFQRLRKIGSGYPLFSGAFLGMAGSGCGACGLPVMSVFGLSGSILPLKGLEFSFLALGLLVLSFILLIRADRVKFCKFNR